MENTKPQASQIRYGSGDSTVDKALKHSVLSFPDYAAASDAAATLPDGQMIESPNAEGNLRKYVVSGNALADLGAAETYLSGEALTALPSWDEVPQVFGKGTTAGVNAQAQALADRDEMLKRAVDTLYIDSSEEFFALGALQAGARYASKDGHVWGVLAVGSGDYPHPITGNGLKDVPISGVITAKQRPTVNADFSSKQQNSHVNLLPVGAHTLADTVPLTGYFNIQGKGEQTQVSVPSGKTGFAYISQSGVFDDHPRNKLSNLRLLGVGKTTKGFSFAEVANIGSLGCADEVVFDNHNIGRHIKQSYGHTGRRNYYRGNNVGLLLENVTSFHEYDIYARYNTDAAVRIIGGQNLSFTGGAVEGNTGKAIDYAPSADAAWGQLNLNDVYFEANGDQAGGVPSINIPLNAPLMVNVRGGSYWLNLREGLYSGPYIFGNSLSMDGATINGNFYAKEVLGFRNTRGPSPGVWNTMSTEALSRLYGLTEPAIFHEFKPSSYEHVFTAAGSSGLVISTKLCGRGNARLPDSPNLIGTAYPYGVGVSTNVTISENSALNYGDGSWVTATFGSTKGDFNNNYLSLTGYTDNTKQFRLFCCLIKPDADCEVGFMQSVGGQSVTGFYKLNAGKIYRMVFAAYAPMTAGSSILRMFPINTSSPVINIKPLSSFQFSSSIAMHKAIDLMCSGSI